MWFGFDVGFLGFLVVLDLVVTVLLDCDGFWGTGTFGLFRMDGLVIWWFSWFCLVGSACWLVVFLWMFRLSLRLRWVDCLYKLGIFVKLVVLFLLDCGLMFWLSFKFVVECVIL